MSDATDRWFTVQALFDRLVELPDDERERELNLACEHDAVLRQQVADLLSADRISGDFIGDAIAEAAEQADASTRVGQTIGSYRLTAALGHGGMGAVYLAERSDDEYRARVAIKFLRSALAAPALARRFRVERQILADLVHPNIARLLDGGTAPDGTPYLVMEYVDGVPLDEWCDRAEWNTRERVALMRRVCEAVQHAHRSLVVHRDLKPSNILVTADGTPKLLDFGIATLVTTGDAEDSQATLLGAMTPTYASPEQLRGKRVTTASDTYSLGVVLYRLLTGAPPFDLSGLSPAEAEQRVVEHSPPAPSSRATGAAARVLHGDLDTIVLKALRVTPDERYLSAADLAEDLRRWLANEPIAARRTSVGYRVRAMARRHPVAVTASTLALLALLASTSVSVVQARRAASARDEARARQQVAEQTTSFLISLFSVTDPTINNGESITARQMLDRGAERVLTGSISAPDVRSSLAISLATIYRNLVEYDAATPLVDTALAVRARSDGEESSEYAAALHEKAELLYTEGEYDSTLTLQRRVLALQQANAPGDNDLTQATLHGLGIVLNDLSQFEESERLLRQALAMNTRMVGDTGISISQSNLALADVLRHQAKYAEAIPLLETSLAQATASMGRKNLDVAQSLNHLSRTMSLAGRNEEALPIVREAISIEKEIFGKPTPETAASIGNLSGILTELKRYDEAEAARRESLAMLRAVFDGDHPYVSGTLSSLGNILMLKQDWRGAEATYREALRMGRKALSPNNPDLGYSLTGLGRALTAQHRPVEAQPVLEEAYQLRSAGMPKGHWHTAVSGIALGECLTALGEPAKAEPILRESAQSLVTTFGESDSRARAARQALAVALRQMGRVADADSLDALLSKE